MPDPCANNPCTDTNTKTLDIPGDPNLTLSQCECVSIVCTSSQGFTWCYKDPSNVFDGKLLADGSYDAGTYGPYQAVNTGEVSYKGKLGKNKPCNIPGPDETLHTITVNG